jgi:hypothetical protein
VRTPGQQREMLSAANVEWLCATSTSSILSMSLIGALGSAGGERLFFNFVNRNRAKPCGAH